MTKKKSKAPSKRDEDAGPPPAPPPAVPADISPEPGTSQQVRKKKVKKDKNKKKVKKEKNKTKKKKDNGEGSPQIQPEIKRGMIVVFKKRGRKGHFTSHPFWVRNVQKSKVELRCITTFGGRTIKKMREIQDKLLKLRETKQLSKKQLRHLDFELDYYLVIPGGSKPPPPDETGEPELALCSKGKNKKNKTMKMPKSCYVEYNVFDPTKHIVSINKLKPYRGNKYALTPKSSQKIDHHIMIAQKIRLQRPTDCLPVAAVGNAHML